MSATRLTMAKARKLIQRELGISGTTLEKTSGMNDNPKYPHYSLQTGNLSIAVSTILDLDGKIIVLHMSSRDGLGSTNRYFYADDFEEATEFMEAWHWEDVFEQVEDKTREPMICRLNRQAQEACQKHYGGHEY